MASLSEILGADSVGSPIHDALVAGVDVLGQVQTVDFVPYIRTVLPIDGFVFWMNASLLSPAQLAQHGLQTAAPVSVQGSLHYASAGHMVEDETIVVRSVDFTSESQITAFAEIAPDVMYVASWTTPLGSFRFTFSRRGSFYLQASVYHYVGDAVYPVFERQLIDDASGFDQRQVVSNSLPIWLSMLQRPKFPSLITLPSLPVYPAFLVPDNLAPPYAAVGIPPSGTRAIQGTPYRDRTNSRFQLVSDRVTVTLYGLGNDEAMDFVDYVAQYSELTGLFGIMNTPVVQDDRRVQVELAAIAMKKKVEYEINYYQVRVRDLARQLIRTVVPTFIPSDDPVPPPHVPIVAFE